MRTMQLSTLLLYALGAPALGLALHSPVNDDTSKPGEPTLELGRVTWERNLEAGLASATQADKPVLLLFQEIPG